MLSVKSVNQADGAVGVAGEPNGRGGRRCWRTKRTGRWVLLENQTDGAVGVAGEAFGQAQPRCRQV
eukprot:365633-Chlamydomonas_euryale.AAC.4